MAALLHGRGGQRGKADDVAGRIDVGNCCLEVLVDGEAASRIRGQADRLQIESRRLRRCGRPHRAGRGGDLLAALQPTTTCRRDAPRSRRPLLHGKRDADAAHLVLQGFDDSVIDKFQQARPLVDQSDVHAHHGQDRGVFRADHAAADDHDRLGKMLEREEAVGVDDRVVVEWNVGRSGRERPTGDDDEVGSMFAARLAGFQCGSGGDPRMRAVPTNRSTLLRAIWFWTISISRLMTWLARKVEVFDRDVLFHAVTRAVQAALAEPREIEDGFAEGFAGDRAGVGADAADDRLRSMMPTFLPSLAAWTAAFWPAARCR